MTRNASSVSLWMATERLPSLPALNTDQRADVCIVGAGIAGLTTAYQLALEGKRVVVLDARGLAAGQTQRTTAHLTNAIDDRYVEIARIHGEEGARLAADSHTAAIDRIEAITRGESIECDFERLDGFLVPGRREDSDIIQQEHAAALQAGVRVELLPRSPLTAFAGPCLRFPRQGQFHPLRYLAGLAQAIRRRGGQIYDHTRVKSVEAGTPVRIHTEAGPVVTADAVVMATNSPINDLVVMHTKQHPYRTYAVGARIGAGEVPHMLLWDTLDPYHYVRLQKASASEPDDFLIVGGEDHKSGQAVDMDQRHAHLEAWTRAHFPTVRSFDFHWSGQVLETVDGLAFIGRNPLDHKNVFIATGDSGEGMIHGTIAGILLTDLIQGRTNPWESLYDPSRKRVGALRELVEEDVNMALQYVDWVTPGEAKSVEEIASGSGAVVRRGLGKVAVYRDEQGHLHEHSAICPHLGAMVRWNPGEKCWDCPAHGSQFDRFGCVINGPANANLPNALATSHGVLLDVDGTLVDSNDAQARAWMQALAEHGVHVDFGTLRRLIGKGGDKLLPEAAGIDTESAQGKAISKRRGEIFVEQFLPTLRPFEGATELLARMKQEGLKLAVASSAKNDELNGLLHVCGADRFIEASTSSDDAKRSKPDPDIVKAALGEINMPPAEVIMLGDTPYDVEAATRARVKVVALRCGGWNDADLSGALRVYDSPADLLAHFEDSPFACRP